MNLFWLQSSGLIKLKRIPHQEPRLLPRYQQGHQHCLQEQPVLYWTWYLSRQSSGCVVLRFIDTHLYPFP